LHSFSSLLRITYSEGDVLDADRDHQIEAALRQAARGDSIAFADLVRAHQAMVFSIGWHFLQDRSLAEDVAQEVFLELYRRLGEIESPAHLTHWLRRVAAHRAIDQGRRHKHRREQPLDGLPEPGGQDRSSDLLLWRQVRQSLMLLPEKQRMVVLLRYQEDLGPAEIADVLKMPVNTVKSTLHRSLQELRGRLARKIGEVRYAFL
jgi:RNA polymerase sigma-70 factor, ECF subfamily